jgi:hypothetical protein
MIIGCYIKRISSCLLWKADDANVLLLERGEEDWPESSAAGFF